ncbi:hypothetical protein PENTCL1PPCAC_24068, partial [Pristionchus entomophagus]
KKESDDYVMMLKMKKVCARREATEISPESAIDVEGEDQQIEGVAHDAEGPTEEEIINEEIEEVNNLSIPNLGIIIFSLPVRLTR